ncbi:MAG TPA: hypothetical protein VGG33_25380 [Polyangia bacterium]
MVKVPQASQQHLPRLTGRERSSAVVLAIMTMALALPSRAAAHPENTPAFVNRYITLSPVGNQLGVDVILLYGTVPAAEKRREMDQNADGFLSETEIAAEKRSWATRASELLSLKVDGKAQSFTMAATLDLNGRLSVNGEPLLVQLRGQLGLGPGDHALEVEAGPDLPRTGETEIVLDAGHPWLLHAGLQPNGQQAAPQPSIKYPAARAQASEPRRAGFVIRAHGALDARAPGTNITVPAILVGFSVLLGAALMWLVRRADKNRRAN